MDIRKKTRVEGTPFVWSTNLSDDDVREFYSVYSERIREQDPEPQAQEGVIHIPLRFGFLEKGVKPEIGIRTIRTQQAAPRCATAANLRFDPFHGPSGSSSTVMA
jgi:hypothetical protein